MTQQAQQVQAIEFNCDISPIQHMLGVALWNFRFDTVHGQFYITDNSFDLVYIQNDEKGNGSFIKCVEYFEKKAIQHKRKFIILDFINMRLKEWFKLRGYDMKQVGEEVHATFN